MKFNDFSVLIIAYRNTYWFYEYGQSSSFQLGESKGISEQLIAQLEGLT